jgi:hypothetical protein
MRIHERDEEDLAKLADGTLDEARAIEVRATLEANPAWAAAFEELLQARRRLRALPPARPDLAARVLERIDAPRRRPRLAPWLAAPVIAAALVALVMVGAPAEQDDGWVARGDARPNVAVLVRAGEPPVRVLDGATLPGPLRLAVDVHALPADAPRAIAVWARDVHGAVTWLRPAWTDANRPPSCERLPESAAVLPATMSVEVDAAPGPLTIGYVVASPERCDVRRLDAALERDGGLPGAERALGLTAAARHLRD